MLVLLFLTTAHQSSNPARLFSKIYNTIQYSIYLSIHLLVINKCVVSSVEWAAVERPSSRSLGLLTSSG